jgi:pyrophosphatase PpaX
MVITLKKINTVLFDLDGTLVDSNELIIESFRQTLKKFNPQTLFSRQEIIDMIGPPLLETFQVINTNPKIIQEMIAFYRYFYKKHEFEYISLYDNVIEMLEILKNKGFNLGIVTTKFKESAMPSISHFKLDKYISNFAFLDTVDEHKPSPKPIYYVLKMFKNVEEAIMVGDNVSDILAGKNANILTCGIEWSLAKEKIKALNPDYWIENYMDLVKIINEEE